MSINQSPKICPVCLRSKKFIFIRDYILPEGDFSLFQCKNCQVQFYAPFQKIKKESYEEIGSYKIREIVVPKIFRTYHKKFLERNKKILPETKILDLGCGTGEFLKELEKRGCEVWGVDFDNNGIEIAKKTFGLKNVFSGSFDDFFKKNDLPKFDMVTIFETIQYLDNPLEFVKNVKKILKPSGKIILSVPSRNRALSKLDGWDMPSFCCLTRWDKNSLIGFFSIAGFKESYVCFIEQFKILVGAINSKTRLGLVNKTANISSQESKRTFFVTKMIYLLGRLKEIIIGFIPASILWFFGKLFKKENGIIYIELENNNE